MSCPACAKLRNISSTLKAVSMNAVKTGMVMNQALGDQRMAICKTNACGAFEDNPPMCVYAKGGCGCYLKVKTPLIVATCPKGKWPVNGGQSVAKKG